VVLVIVVAVVVLLVTSTLLGAYMAPPGPIAPPRENPAPVSGQATGASIQQTGTAVNFTGIASTLWKNSSTSNQSNTQSWLVNFTRYTSIGSFAATFTVSAGNLTPQVNVSEGSTTFVNGTEASQFVVGPTVGTTPLTSKVILLTNGSGGPVADAAYPIFTTVQQTISYSLTTLTAWTLSSTKYTVPYQITAPKRYYLNTTTIYIPFPTGLTVNYSSASVTGINTYQVSTNGIYVTNQSLLPGHIIFLNATFQPVPISTGPAILLDLGPAHLIVGTTNNYTEQTNYTNNLALPYVGLWVLRLNPSFAYTVNPTTLTVLAQNRTIANSSVAVQSSLVIISPNVLLVGVASTVHFYVNFTSPTAPPALCVTTCTTSVIGLIGTFPVTVGEFLQGLMVALLGVLLLLAFVPSKYRGVDPWSKDILFVELVLASIWGVLYLV
jgi:hypothetical protein